MNIFKKRIDGIEDNNLFIFISFFILALTIYIPSLTNLNFFWDDEKFVYLNPKFMNSPSWVYFWNIKSDLFKVWPFGYTVFWAVIKSFPESSLLVFKILNILFHSLNAFLIYKLLKKLNVIFPYLLALLCLIHPLNVESVSWMFQLLTILSFTFFIISTFLIVNFLDNQKLKYIIGAFFFFGLSLLTKGIALLAPFFFLMLFIGKKIRIKILYLIPFFILSLFLGVLTQKGTEDLSKLDYSVTSAFINDYLNLSKKDIAPKGKTIVNEDFANFIFAANKKPDTIVFNKTEIFSQALVHYPLKLIAPYPLHFLYKPWQIPIFITILILVIIIALIYVLYKKTNDKKIFAFLTYTFFFLLPYMGVTFITFFYWSNVSDRYTYYIVPAFAFLLGITLKLWNKNYGKLALTYYIIILTCLNIHHGLLFNNLFDLYHDTFLQKKHPVTYSLLFEQYFYKMDLNNSEKILLEGIKKFPKDELLQNDLIRLESLRRFYNQTR